MSSVFFVLFFNGRTVKDFSAPQGTNQRRGDELEDLAAPVCAYGNVETKRRREN